MLKIGGAAYLAYLGLRLILGPAQDFEFEEGRSLPLRRMFLVGALSNLSNPKITIFYFAFLPQFVSTDADSPALVMLILGSGFAALTFVVKAPIGYFAGLASRWIRSRPLVIKAINRLSGAVLIGLGVKLALEQR